MNTRPHEGRASSSDILLLLLGAARSRDDARTSATRGRKTPQARTEPLVMVVDDDPDTQEIYRTVLEHAGFRVLVVGDGAEAVRRAREALPDLILMDIDLPGLDGWEATRRLKAHQPTREIPVVGISASAGEEFRWRAMTLGFESYHAKPFLPTHVVDEVRRTLGLEPTS